MADKALDLDAMPFGLAPSTPTDYELLSHARAGVQGGAAPLDLNALEWRNVEGASNYQLSGDTRASDYGRGLGKGFVDILASLAGAVELTGAVDPGTLSRAVEQYGEEITANMSPSAQENMRREWTDLSADGALRNPKAVLQQFMTVLPSLATSITGAGIGARVAVGAATKAAGKELTKKQAAKIAATAGGATGAAIEAPQISGATINELRGAMDGMSHEELMQHSPHYVKEFKAWGDEAEARRAVIQKAAGKPALINGVLGGMVSTVPGALWGRIATKTGANTTRLQHFAKTFGAEAGEEVAQEGIAGVTTGAAQKAYVDSRHDPMAGMGERLASAAALGGLGGLAGGALTVSGRNKDVAPAVTAAIETALPNTPADAEPDTFRSPMFPLEQDELDLQGGEGGTPIGPDGQYDMFGYADDDGRQPVPLEPSPDQLALDLAPVQEGQQDMFGQPEPEFQPMQQQEMHLPAQQPRLDDEQGDLFAEPDFVMGEGELTPQHATRKKAAESIPAPVLGLPAPSASQYLSARSGIQYSLPLDGVVPEPVTDIIAQLQEVLNPESDKDTMYLSPVDVNQDDPSWGGRASAIQERIINTIEEHMATLSEEEQFDLLPYDAGLHGQTLATRGIKGRVGGLEFFQDKNGGLVISSNLEALNKYAQSPQGEESRAMLLDYPVAKQDLPDPDDTVTMAVVNEDGSVAESFVMMNTPDVISRVRQVMEQRVRGGMTEKQRIVVQPTNVALQDRISRAEREWDGTGAIPNDQQMGLPFAQRFEPPEPAPPAAEDVASMDETKAIAAYVSIEDAVAAGIAAEEGATKYEAKQKAAQPVEEKVEPKRIEPTTKQKRAATLRNTLRAVNTDIGRLDTIAKTKERLNPETQELEKVPVKERNDAIKEREKQRVKRKRLEGMIKAAESQPETPREKSRKAMKGVITRVNVEAKQAEEARKAKLVSKAKDELNKPGAKGRTVAALKPKVEAGRETATGPEVRTLTRAQKQQQPTKGGVKGSDAKLVARMKGLRNVLVQSLVKDFGLTQDEADAFEEKELGKDFITTLLPTGKRQREEFDRVVKRYENGDERAYDKLLLVMNETIKDKMGAAVIRYRSPEALTMSQAINMLSAWKGLWKRRKSPEDRRREAVALFGKLEISDQLATIFGQDLDELMEGKTPWAIAGNVKLTNKNEDELKKLIREQAEQDTTYYVSDEKLEVVRGSNVVASGTDDVLANRAEVLGSTTYEGNEAEQPAKAETQWQEKISEESKGTRRKESPGKKRKDELDAEAERLRQDIGGRSASGDGSTRETHVGGQAWVAREPDGSRVVPRKQPKATETRTKYAKNYDGLGNVKQHQVDAVNIFHAGREKAAKNGEPHRLLIADGTGTGKTLEMLLMARTVVDNGGTVLYVTPNEDVWNGAREEALSRNLFDDGPKGKQHTRKQLQGITAVGYTTLSKVTGEYDLVIYDEAHALRDSNGVRMSHAANIKATSTVYTTATVSDKTEFLGLLALVDGKVLDNGLPDLDTFAKSLGGAMVTANDSKGKEKKVLTGDLAVVKKLEKRIQFMADGYSYRSVNNKPLAVREVMEVKRSEGAKVGGKSPAAIEQQLIEAYNAGDLTKSDLLAHSTKLSELAKVPGVLKNIINDVRSGKKQVVVFSEFFQDETNRGASNKEGRVTFKHNGKQLTYELPSALRLLEEGLAAANITVASYYGAKPTTHAVDKFQRGDVDVILGTYAKMAEGVNLDDNKGTDAGGSERVQYNLSRSYSPDVQRQANGRTDRTSTMSTPVIRDVEADFIADEHRNNLVEYKSQLSDILQGQEVDLAYSDSNLRLRKGTDLNNKRAEVKVMPWGINRGAKVYSDIVKEFKRLVGDPDERGYFTFGSAEKYLREGQTFAHGMLTKANQLAGFEDTLTTGTEAEQTDSAEGTATEVESKEAASLEPLEEKMNEAYVRQQAAYEQARVAKTPAEVKAALQQMNYWNNRFATTQAALLAAEEKNNAPAMLAPNDAKTSEKSQQFFDALEAGEPLTAGDYITMLLGRRQSNSAERRLLRKIRATIGDTTIKAASVAEVEFRTGQEGAVAAYDYQTNEVLISPPVAGVSEAYIHETLHAVMHYAIDNNPSFRRKLENMMRKAAVELEPWLQTLPADTAKQMQSALTSPHEFVSYGLSNPELKAELNKIRMRDVSMLRKFYEAVLEFLGMGRRNTLLKELEEYSLEHMSADRSFAPLNHSTGADRAMAMLGKDSKIVNSVTGLLDQSEVASDKWYDSVRKLGLPLATLRQINTLYGKVLDKANLGVNEGDQNPVRAWFEAMMEKEVTVKTETAKGNEMHRDLQEVLNALGPNASTLNELIRESTRLKVWPNLPWEHELNEHAHKSAFLKAEHARLAADYQKLDQLQKGLDATKDKYKNRGNIWNRLETFYREERRSNFKRAVSNIFNLMEDVYYVPEDGPAVKITHSKDMEHFAEGLLDKKYAPQSFTVRPDDKMDDTLSKTLVDAVADNLSGTLTNGPYFPSKRFGKYAVNATRNTKKHQTTLTPEQLAKAEKQALKKTRDTYGEDINVKEGLGKERYEEHLRHSKQAMLRKVLTDEVAARRDDEESVYKTRELVFDGDSATMESYVPYMSQHPTETAAAKVRDDLRDAGWEKVSTYIVAMDGKDKIMSSNNTPLVAHLRDKLGGEPAVLKALEASLLQLMPETAVKHEQQRRVGVEGGELDQSRVLASHVASSAWYVGQLAHGKEISDALGALSSVSRKLENHPVLNQREVRKVKDIVEEIQKHAKLDADPHQLGDGLRMMGDVGFVYMLFSPAYMAVNLTQPHMYGTPWLWARNEGANIGAAEAMNNAYRTVRGEIGARAVKGLKGMLPWNELDPDLFDFLQRSAKTGEVSLSEHLNKKIMNDKKLSDPALVVDMLEYLSKRNVMDFTMAMDLSSAAEGRTGARQAVMDRFRILPHLTEVLNRSVTAIAAYEMEMSKQGTTHEQAMEFAERAVTETQFDYTLMNKPRWMSERSWKMAKPVFMFMQHPQHVYGLFVQSVLMGSKPAMRHIKRRMNGEDMNTPEAIADRKAFRENYRTLVGILGTHLVMGGVTGAMFEPIKWALGMAIMAFEKIEGEPPEETEVVVQRWLNETFGDGMGEVLGHGLPSLIGLHLSDNLSISSLALMNTPGRYSMDREGVEGLWFSFGGPSLSIVGNVAEGIKDIGEGDVLGGVAKASPRSLRDLTRAYKLYSEGLKDSRGNTIINAEDLSAYELFAESMGIRTRPKAKAYENKAAIDSQKYFYRDEAMRFKERLVRASDDPRKWRELVDEIRAANKRRPPSMQIKITRGNSQRQRDRLLQELGAIVQPSERWIADKGRVWNE